MPGVDEIVRWGVIAPLLVILAIVSVSDIRYRRIPNWAVLVICGLSIPWILWGAGPSILSAFAALLIALGLTWPLYAFGLLGAGDSKLLMAVCLFVGLQKLLVFFVIVAVAGGLVAGVGLLMEPTRALVLFQMKGMGGREVPYGVAIAIATGLVLVWPFTHLTSV